MKVTVSIPKNLIANIQNIYKELAEPVMVAVAVETQNELMNQKPPRAPRGAMRFVSDKQRKFVMASIANGDITVPYKRGIDKRSQRMNRSFKIVRSPRSVQLTNSASYWKYVIGSEQAHIHKGRWKTLDNVVIEVLRSGLIEDTVKTILRKRFD
jgi:hypothetical protein